MNSPLSEYLGYYRNCYSPSYAVLVTGEWGTGKTFQVKNALGEENIYYVSLFGINTIDDLHSSVLALMFPNQSKLKKIVGRLREISIGLGSFYSLGSLLPGLASAVLRQNIKNDRVLVFDDLERSGITLGDTLGVINTYVEHHNCRVVVIAHDEKITNEFNTVKEKIFGQTIQIEPQIGDAFAKFCSQISGKKNVQFAKDHERHLIDIFISSETKSLRILKHVIEDLSRLYNLLEEKHLQNADAISELVQLFSALDMEVRAGNLVEEDLKNRGNAYYQHALRRQGNHADDQPIEEPKLLLADKKYGTIDLANSLITDTAIVSMLIDGLYDATQLRSSLDSSPYFLIPNEVAPWKVVIGFDDTEDDDVDLAVSRILKQFDNREITISGEMLHVFCLRFMLAEAGVIAGDFPTVTSDCIKYIDDLLSADRLPPRELDWRWIDNFDRSYDGHGYWIPDGVNEHFKAIFDHLVQARENALERKFPEITAELVDLIKRDASAFAEKISHTNSGKNPYAIIPILGHIQAELFVDAWLSAPKINWTKVFLALRQRYEGNRLAHELASELNWLQAVTENMTERANKESGLRAYRIRRVNPSVLLPQH